ncbi:hypothetical protein [Brevibacillus reuszeri]|uniref:hypothetical protein n=1 Tax=Brevibacillus reuszeri TaxID=54915 RepID=UPI003D194B2D
MVRAYPDPNKTDNPRDDWTFEGWDGTNWILLDKQTDISAWTSGERKEYTFTNPTAYKKFRIKVTKDNDGYNGQVSIGALEMMRKITDTNVPGPDSGTDPNPTSDYAFLVIKMIRGLEKEFDLNSSEVENFIDWYNGRADGRGKETYILKKTLTKDLLLLEKIM